MRNILNFNQCKTIDDIIKVILFPTLNREFLTELKTLLSNFRILDYEEGEDSVYITNDKIKIKFRRNSEKELTEYIVFNGKSKGGEYLPEYWNNKKNSVQRVINFLKSKINES